MAVGAVGLPQPHPGSQQSEGRPGTRQRAGHNGFLRIRRHAAKFVPDLNDVRIQLAVNGELMMDASTSGILYKIDEQFSVISEYLTIEPGNILFTGSPLGSAGVRGTVG